MRTARSAFLLEIDDTEATGADAVCGRVEHVSGHVEHVLTGRALHFRSWESLRDFLESTIAPSSAAAPPQRRPRSH